MTVADMKRLEHAARLSMGGLLDADMPAKPFWHARSISLAGLALFAAVLAATMVHLI
ncbi:MAG TPA: hypothetical protein VGM46_10760 [Mesorhizobium sp.]